MQRVLRVVVCLFFIANFATAEDDVRLRRRSPFKLKSTAAQVIASAREKIQELRRDEYDRGVIDTLEQLFEVSMFKLLREMPDLNNGSYNLDEWTTAWSLRNKFLIRFALSLEGWIDFIPLGYERRESLIEDIYNIIDELTSQKGGRGDVHFWAKKYHEQDRISRTCQRLLGVLIDRDGGGVKN